MGRLRLSIESVAGFRFRSKLNIYIQSYLLLYLGVPSGILGEEDDKDIQSVGSQLDLGH